MLPKVWAAKGDEQVAGSAVEDSQAVSPVRSGDHPRVFREVPHLLLTLDLREPVELRDFVSVFTSLASEFERFVLARYPDLEGGTEVYVTEVRRGSIVAELMPWVVITGQAVLGAGDSIMLIEDFVNRWKGRIGSYFMPGGKVEDADKSSLRDFMGYVAAIANDPAGSATLEAVAYEDGKRKIRAQLKFDTTQARAAREQIENQRRALEANTGADRERLLMVFVQTNTKTSGLGARTGERVVVEDISPKDLPLIYASSLAEERIKHEIREADENVFKKGFIVDLSIQIRAGRPVGYRVTQLHQVIDLPDDAEG